MRNVAIWAVALALLATGAVRATAQGRWSLTAGAGLSRINDQFEGPALGALGLRVGVMRETRVAFGLELGHYRFGESAAASVCLNEDCTEVRYEGTIETSVTEVQGAARYGLFGPLLPYVVASMGYVRTDERYDYYGAREDSMQGVSGSIGVGWVPLEFSRAAALGIEGRLHGLVVGDNDGDEAEVGLGTYYTLLAVLRFRFGG
jgi:hypothetical protein